MVILSGRYVHKKNFHTHASCVSLKVSATINRESGYRILTLRFVISSIVPVSHYLTLTFLVLDQLETYFWPFLYTYVCALT